MGSMAPEVAAQCLRSKTLPSVFHNSMGTLYEEPCLVFIQVCVLRFVHACVHVYMHAGRYV